MSSPAAAILGDLTLPGLHFAPVDDEIVQLYLLPRVRGHPDLFPGLIVDDDAAANTQPWELFDRHGLPDEDGAQQASFFFVHHKNGGARRPDRHCRGGGTWKSQKHLRDDLGHETVVDGEQIKWSRHNLNFHMGAGAGSWGWVMHEYAIAGSSLKLCAISFSGHGHKRKRVPDEYLAAGESATTQRPRVAADQESGSATSASSGTTTTTFEFDQGFRTAQYASEGQQLLQDSSDEEDSAAEMVAEMTSAQEEPTTWEFQAEQVPQTMNASAPPEFQPPPPPWTATTTSSPESALAAQEDASQGFQHLADAAQDIAAMIDEMTNSADIYLDQVPPVMDQSSCNNIGKTDFVHWEGIDFF